jgi:TATA-box binding protein (TBP) (component of TFIID and TFIIIB)
MEYDHIVCVFHSHAILFEAMHNACTTVLKNGADMFRDNVIDVSTMTLSCKLDTRVDLPRLTDAQARGDIAKLGFDAKTDPMFPNQVTLLVPRLENGARPTRRRKKKFAGCNVKVCVNGSLNLTGCKSLHEGSLVIALLLKTLSDVGAVSVQARLSTVKLGMINTILDVGVGVRLDTLMHNLERAGITVHFDSVRHAGVRVSTPDGYAFVFRSGNVTCGSTRFEAVPRLWQTLMKALSMNGTTYECPTALALDELTKRKIAISLVENNIDFFKSSLPTTHEKSSVTVEVP